MAYAYEDPDEGSVKHRVQQFSRRGSSNEVFSNVRRNLIYKDNYLQFRENEREVQTLFRAEKNFFSGRRIAQNVANDVSYPWHQRSSENWYDKDNDNQKSHYFNENSHNRRRELFYQPEDYYTSSKEFLENLDGIVIKRNLLNRSLSADDFEKELNRQNNFISSYNESLAELPIKSSIVKHQLPWHSVTQCYYCGNDVFSSDQIKIGSNTWHKWCLKCDQCLVTLSTKKDVIFYKDLIYCVHCYNDIRNVLNRTGRFEHFQYSLEQNNSDSLKYYPFKASIRDRVQAFANFNQPITYDQNVFFRRDPIYENQDRSQLFKQGKHPQFEMHIQRKPIKSILKNGNLLYLKNGFFEAPKYYNTKAIVGRNYSNDFRNKYLDYNFELNRGLIFYDRTRKGGSEENQNEVFINMHRRLKNKSHSSDDLEELKSTSYDSILDSARDSWIEKIGVPLNPSSTFRRSSYVDKSARVPSYYENGTSQLEGKYKDDNQRKKSWEPANISNLDVEATIIDVKTDGIDKKSPRNYIQEMNVQTNRVSESNNQMVHSADLSDLKEVVNNLIIPDADEAFNKNIFEDSNYNQDYRQKDQSLTAVFQALDDSGDKNPEAVFQTIDDSADKNPKDTSIFVTQKDESSLEYSYSHAENISISDKVIANSMSFKNDTANTSILNYLNEISDTECEDIKTNSFTDLSSSLTETKIRMTRSLGNDHKVERRKSPLKELKPETSGYQVKKMKEEHEFATNIEPDFSYPSIQGEKNKFASEISIEKREKHTLGYAQVNKNKKQTKTDDFIENLSDVETNEQIENNDERIESKRKIKKSSPLTGFLASVKKKFYKK